ncbi:MAG: hypothetical protein AAFX94_25710, partial [Myxococcota bacterium]
ELEAPIVQSAGIRAVIFADAGNAYDDGEDHRANPRGLDDRRFELEVEDHLLVSADDELARRRVRLENVGDVARRPGVDVRF